MYWACNSYPFIKTICYQSKSCANRIVLKGFDFVVTHRMQTMNRWYNERNESKRRLEMSARNGIMRNIWLFIFDKSNGALTNRVYCMRIWKDIWMRLKLWIKIYLLEQLLSIMLAVFFFYPNRYTLGILMFLFALSLFFNRIVFNSSKHDNNIQHSYGRFSSLNMATEVTISTTRGKGASTT